MEKKIKNINKSIMIIVAVLLTLVLISTSTVSGIFAKYVVTKSATTEVSLKKFGIKLTMLQGANFTGTADGSLSDDNTTMNVTISNIQLAPNDTLPEVVKFEIERDPDVDVFPVDVRIKIKATVVLEDCEYDNVTYVPIGFYANKNASSSQEVLGAWQRNVTQESLGTSITDGIKTFLGTGASKIDDSAAIKIASKNGTSPEITVVGFGFFCPKEASNVENSDVIMTQLAEQGAKVKVTYTVSLEQIV